MWMFVQGLLLPALLLQITVLLLTDVLSCESFGVCGPVLWCVCVVCVYVCVVCSCVRVSVFFFV